MKDLQRQLASSTNRRAPRTLVLLTIVYALGYADRNIFNLLLNSIKLDFHLSDTVMGLITGLGFTIFQLALAIPIARWADTARRTAILTFGLFIWSLMTGLSGLAPSALLLAMARMGVGAGEACLTAPSHSILADCYPKERRPQAFSIMAAGGEVGIILAFLIGGWVSHAYGWRAAFLVVGLPGLLLALVCHFTLPEPVRGGADGAPHAGERPDFGVTLKILWRQRSFVLSIIAGALMGLEIFGIQVWTPTHLERAHHLNVAQVGTAIAVLRSALSVSGALAAGYLTERLACKDDRWRLRTPAVICLISAPAVLGFAFAPSLWMALVCLGIVNMMIGAQLGPVFAATMTVVPGRTRAMASSLSIFSTQIFGLGLGSLAIGAISDALSPIMGDRSLSWGFVIPAVGALIASATYWIASRHIVADMATAAAIDRAATDVFA